MSRVAQDIILRPIITENSMDGIADRKYTFEVAKDANKIEIAKAVEELFGVKVAKVNTINVDGKLKYCRRQLQSVSYSANKLHTLLVVFVSTVGEIEARYVHACAEHLFKHVLFKACRAHCAYYLGFS